MLAFSLAVPDVMAEKEKTKEQLEKEAKQKAEEAEARRKELEERLKPLFSFSFNDVSANLVIIECKSSIGATAGSGFIAKADGKTYIYTNQHVVLGADQISLRTVDGEEIKAKAVELSLERDIARVLIDDREGAFEISKNLAIDMPLAVFGNSEGSGVATELYGEITSVGSDLIEVSAEFVSGNSGSPVLNPEKEVIGIASYVQFSAPQEEDENEEKARFESTTRRFCYRLTDVQFAPVNWRKYNDKYGKPYIITRDTIESLALIIDGWYDAPFDSVPTENYPDISLTSWASTHNKMVERVNTIMDKGYITRAQQSKLRDEVYKSAHDLANVAHRMSVDVGKQADEKALTGFLRTELEGYSYGLEFASQVLDYVGKEVADYIDNL
jgi:hypothetical protein